MAGRQRCDAPRTEEVVPVMDLLRALIGEDGKGVVWLLISLILGVGS
jgi:hypothetical protein